MSLIRDRLPAREETLYVFGICLLLVHIWSVINVLNEVPSWLLRMGWWDLLGVVAYSQVFALFDSLLLLIAVLPMAIVLPARLFRENFVSQGSVAVILASLMAVWALKFGNTRLIWSYKRLLFAVGVALLAILVASFAITRPRWVRRAVDWFAERVFVLAIFYLVIDGLSIGIVLVRNIVGLVT